MTGERSDNGDYVDIYLDRVSPAVREGCSDFKRGVYSLRLSIDERGLLARAATEKNITLAEYIRSSALSSARYDLGHMATLPREAWEGLVAYGRECVAAKLEGREPPSPDPNRTYKEWLASVEKCKADYEQRARG